MNGPLYESLARLLEYPRDDFGAQVDACRALARDEQFAAFAVGTENLRLAELEELYIQSFDFDPKATLDLGWQLFAEDYNRGLFLAKLRSESRRLNVPETCELPDHLPHILRLLVRMTPAEASDFAATCGIPAVEKIFAALPETNPFRPLIACVLLQLCELAATSVEVALR